MALRDWIAAAVGGLTLIIMAMGAQAFPFTYSTVEFKAAARETSNVDKAASRHCWWRMGDSTVVAMRAHTFLGIARATAITTLMTLGKYRSAANVGGSRRKWVAVAAEECDVNSGVVLLHYPRRANLTFRGPTRHAPIFEISALMIPRGKASPLYPLRA